MAEPRNPLLKRRLGRVLGISSVVLGLVLVGSSQLRMQYIVDRLNEEIAQRTASQCVSAWNRVEDIRNGDEKVYRRNASTLLALSQTGTPPTPEQQKRIDQYRAQVELDVVEIRAANADPKCDLKAARRVLGEDADGTLSRLRVYGNVVPGTVPGRSAH